MPKQKGPRVPNLTIENAKILFRNFSGLEGRFNLEGRRNFCVLLPNDDALQLKEDGWNVKWLKPRDEEDTEQAYLKVNVSYNKYPPIVFLIRDKKKTEIDEDTIHILDWADITLVDVEINPSSWDMNGKTGIKAYLKTMYITLAENELEKKYRNIPDSAASIVQEDDQP